ncbi:MAG: acetate--CoA ligase family protein [Alphaproteobacteria bacterium]|jgi:acyl-CoA synthetase (NDP forming)
MFRNVDPLLKPKSIAIVGASETGGDGWSRVLFNNLKEAGFPVPTYLINPRREELWGEKVYPNFASLPEAVDHALVIVPARFVNDMIREGVDNGLKAATIFSASFGEGRKKIGLERGEELKAIIAESGLSVCGPNCMGLFCLPQDIQLYPTTRLRNLPKGEVGGIFHSGGTLGYWFAQAAQRGLGFSYAMSCGNEFGLDSADYLNFLVDDPDTEIIVGMIESIRRPKEFMEAARRAFEAKKPVILMKLGSSELGKEQAKTHTGAVAVDDDVFNAMCHRYGITRCKSIDEMVDFALAFRQKRLPRGNKLAVVTTSGGAVGLTLEAVGDEGGELAELSSETFQKMDEFVPEGVDVHNPMDAGSTLAGKVPDFCELCEMFAADDDVDIIAVQGRVPLADDAVKTPESYIKLKDSTNKPIFAFTRMAQNCDAGLREFQDGAGMPFLFSVPTMVRSMQALVHYSAARRRGLPELPDVAGEASNVSEDRLAAVLSARGLTAPKQTVASDPGGAAVAATEIGFPVVLKIVSDEISHKTEAGGVVLGLGDADAVRDAAIDLQNRIGAEKISGFLVQEMVDGLEMLVGVREDPDFGPLVVVGLGGIFVELMKDVSLRLAPINEADAKEMLSELRGAKALEGFRGQAPRDVDALAKSIVALSDFFVDHRTWLSEIEVNPVIVLEEGKGVRAVDVRPVRRD